MHLLDAHGIDYEFRYADGRPATLGDEVASHDEAMATDEETPTSA